MAWTVLFHGEFDLEFEQFPEAVQDGLLVAVGVLRLYGPALGRPHADTLAGSKFKNMKELRFFAENGAWRVAFAFDTERQAIVLVACDKSGVAQKRFYKSLIEKADARFASHLRALKGD
ncbi:MAG: hypothetical protein RL145_31 [Pseudomonadota bacterium]|jgi:hypothetical protein